MLLVVSLAAALQVTLAPVGRGWAWGSPSAELHWYVTGLDSAATRLQLLGNLGLLATPAVAVGLLWPRAARGPVLAVLAGAAAASIELLQWVLPLGRVVSPLDAALNALGAVAAGALAAALHPAARAGLRPGAAGSAAGPAAGSAAGSAAR